MTADGNDGEPAVSPAMVGNKDDDLDGRLDSKSGCGDDDGRRPGYNDSRAQHGPLPEGMRVADDVDLTCGVGDDGR